MRNGQGSNNSQTHFKHERWSTRARTCLYAKHDFLINNLDLAEQDGRLQAPARVTRSRTYAVEAVRHA